MWLALAGPQAYVEYCKQWQMNAWMESSERKTKKKVQPNKIETNERAHVFASKVYYFVLKVNKLIRVALACVSASVSTLKWNTGRAKWTRTCDWKWVHGAVRKRLCIVRHLRGQPPRPGQAKLKLDIRRTHTHTTTTRATVTEQNGSCEDCNGAASETLRQTHCKWQRPVLRDFISIRFCALTLKLATCNQARARSRVSSPAKRLACFYQKKKDKADTPKTSNVTATGNRSHHIHTYIYICAST